MPTTRTLRALAGVALLAGCVPPPPPGPTIAAYPGQGKDYNAFQRDDYQCRDEAERSIGGVNPSAAAANNGVATAAIGTGIGAAAGALIGAATGHVGAGAAIGAGGGLLVGTSVGAQNAAYTGNSIQAHYNVTYAQCMVGHGDDVQGARRRWRRPYYGPGPYAAGPDYPPPPPNGDPGPDQGPGPGYNQGPDQPPPGY